MKTRQALAGRIDAVLTLSGGIGVTSMATAMEALARRLAATPGVLRARPEYQSYSIAPP